jgi:hypothetical protein
MQRQNVGVIEPGGDLDFTDESLRSQRCSQLRAEDLQSHGAVEFQVSREIHGCHPASTEFALNGVTFG